MALQPCRECGKEVSSEAASCPHCGIAAAATDANVVGRGILIVVRVLLLVGVLIWTIPAVAFGSPTPCGMLKKAMMRQAMAEPMYMNATSSERAAMLTMGGDYVDGLLATMGPTKCASRLYHAWAENDVSWAE